MGRRCCRNPHLPISSLRAAQGAAWPRRCALGMLSIMGSRIDDHRECISTSKYKILRHVICYIIFTKLSVESSGICLPLLALIFSNPSPKHPSLSQPGNTFQTVRFYVSFYVQFVSLKNRPPGGNPPETARKTARKTYT